LRDLAAADPECRPLIFATRGHFSERNELAPATWFDGHLGGGWQTYYERRLSNLGSVEKRSRSEAEDVHPTD
jgi:hypothetical protein